MQHHQPQPGAQINSPNPAAPEDARAPNSKPVVEAARRIAGDSVSCKDINGLRHFAGAMLELTGARRVVLGVAQGEGSEFSDVVTAGFSPEEQEQIETSPSDARADVEVVLRLLMEREEPLRWSATPATQSGEAEAEALQSGQAEEEAFLGLALRCGNCDLGALYLTGKAGGGAFSRRDQVHVQGMAVYVALAIDNLQMFERERSLVAGLLHAQEEERRSIACDLHDGLTQYVMAAHIHLEAFEHCHGLGHVEKASHALGQASQFLQKSVKESRRLINGLRLLALEDLGLGSALEALLNEEKEHAEWSDVQLACNLGGQRFDAALETAVYRIAQEALSNARRHSRTKWVHLKCERECDEGNAQARLRLEVRDGGCGFDSVVFDQCLPVRDGIGLLSMEERTRMLGGEFESRSAPGEGASIVAVFPLIQSPESLSQNA